EPLHRHVIEPASASAAARSHLGGAIPVLLVLMAISGAFFPALDLIAGERERGTLESLLSWPGDRRAIFLGKLLVVTVASQLTVMLNLLSLGLTLGIVVATVAGGRDLLSAVGPGTGLGILAIGFVVLLPVNLMLAALSLALAGIANSFKEAQNYLTPLVLVVMALASACLIPDLRPSMLTDMVPVLGPLLALKQSLQSPQPDYLHLGVATAASTALAAVFIGWSVRLLDAERFLYPSLVRAGWGRFRRWGQGPATPGGVEVLGVFAVSFGLFVLAGGLLHPLGPLFATVATLTIAVALPAVVHTWLGAYDRARTLYWRRPEAPVEWLRPVLLVPFCLMMAGGLSQLQIHVMGPPPEQLQMIEQLLKDIRDNYGIVGLMLAVAVAPGVCEELLCRGTLFAGLRRGVGTTGAVMISAFLFGIYHGSPYRFFPQAALGVVLALLVLRSGSIWTAILLHTLYNGTAVAIALAYEHQQAATDAAEAPVVMAEQSAQGPLPALATLALGVVGIVVVFRARRSRRPAAAQSA
ncbi:MAG: type II CAAX prenyl endopeptidase Rce1 family protein, partial [Planctomycetota bacterium]